MENVVVLLIVGAACAIAGYLLGRSRVRGDPQLEAQLAATREQANRLGVHAAEIERDANQLRAQLMESVQGAAQLEERTRQLQARLDEERRQGDEKVKLLEEARVALENSFKSLSADALKSNNLRLYLACLLFNHEFFTK